MNKSNLIVLEGVSGVGKTTIANKLFEKGWLYISEVDEHHLAKKYTEEYFVIAEEIKIKKYVNSKADKIIMDRSPISIVAHNYVRKQLKLDNSYNSLTNWFEEVIKPIKDQKFVYIRTDNFEECIKRKWGYNLERFPKKFLEVNGMKLWTQKEPLRIFQEYYDNFFNSNSKSYNFKVIDAGNQIDEIVNLIIQFYEER